MGVLEFKLSLLTRTSQMLEHIIFLEEGNKQVEGASAHEGMRTMIWI